MVPLSLEKITVWILAPYLVSEDSNIDYYYDYSQSIAEYKKVFETLKLPWHWLPVTLQTYRPEIDKIASANQNKDQIVFNLCDGDEINKTPGISVIHYLEEKGICYTGSDTYFYRITTSKIPMKEAFDLHHVATAPWLVVKDENSLSKNIFQKLGTPIILKPAVSGGSMGIGIKNVVNNLDECKAQLSKMNSGYRGWELTADGIIAESFITGPEFTVFILGSFYKKETAIIFTPVERVFHSSLPDKEKFLSFDRLWEIYEEEPAMPGNDFFYQYQEPPISLQEKIKKIAWDAFASCNGMGYARVDIRMDEHSKKMYVLEVNAQCGISEDEDYTSIGAILRVSKISFTELVLAILQDTILRKNNSRLQ